jgi:DNA polymerase-3 subunit delta
MLYVKRARIMTYEALMKDLQGGKIKPVYLLEGEEDFYIDRASDFLENKLLSETEKEFNLQVFYGRDADWTAVLNACRRYPVFSERQVVMIKEAQDMKTLDKLESYLQKPQDSTVLVLTHKHGKLDGRTHIRKLIEKTGPVLTSQRLKDYKLPEWIQQYANALGHQITPEACMLLTDHIGSDLSRQAGEIDKLLLNLPAGKKIDADAIEQYVGISKEYNVFEFQKALAAKDLGKVTRMMHYFSHNPKAAPLPMLLVVLYSFFSKVHVICLLPGRTANLASLLKVPPFFLNDYMKTADTYGRKGTERVLLILHEYNLRSVGIDDPGTPPGELLREMVMKMLL